MAQLSPFSTGRLVGTRPVLGDVDDWAALHGDPRVAATLGGRGAAGRAGDLLERVIDLWARDGFAWWTLRTPEGRFAGHGGLRRTPVEGAFTVEVAWALVPELWGRGLATEVVLAAIDLGFSQLSLTEIVSFTLPSNVPSRRVMERAGMRYDRRITYAGLPHVLYRITR
jgi:[ribosomal protein S5]-alanine N-acetyltransferase